MPKVKTASTGGSKFAILTTAIAGMKTVRGLKGADKASAASVAAAGLGEQAVEDAIKSFRLYEKPGDPWYTFNGLSEGSRALPALDRLVTMTASLHGFAIGPQAEDVAKRFVDAMEDLKQLIAYGRTVTAFITYIRLMQNVLENMHAGTSEDENTSPAEPSML